MRWNMLHTAIVPSGPVTREEVNDFNWKTKYGYALPMSRATHCSWSAISDPETLRGLGVDMSKVGDLPRKGQWALNVHECHHPMEALHPTHAGIKRLVVEDQDWQCFNNGLCMLCMVCGGRWQRNDRVFPNSMISAVTGKPLKPYEIGIALPLPKGSQWSLAAVGH